MEEKLKYWLFELKCSFVVNNMLVFSGCFNFKLNFIPIITITRCKINNFYLLM